MKWEVVKYHGWWAIKRGAEYYLAPNGTKYMYPAKIAADRDCAILNGTY